MLDIIIHQGYAHQKHNKILLTTCSMTKVLED